MQKYNKKDRCQERNTYLGKREMIDAAYIKPGAVVVDVGIHANFAPVVDINTNPGVQVLGLRAFGSDPEEVATLALAYERGMREGGILTSAKHFPGHGEASVDSHRSLPVLELDRARLDSVELRPFRELIAAGVPMVMIGHLSVPSLDPTGTPASISRPIITGVLKGEMGFDGIVITDALEMRGLLNGRDSCEVVLEAFRAGADILLMPKDAQAPGPTACSKTTPSSASA